MRRVLMIAGAVAAMAAFSNRAMAAHSAAELHIFFGAPVNAVGDIPGAMPAGDVLSNPSPVVLPGSNLVFPIWMRVLPGDTAGGNGNLYTAVGFRVYAESATPGSFSNSGNADNAALGGWTPSGRAIPGVGSGAANIPALPSLKLFRSGQWIQKGGADSAIGLGNYFLGYMEVHVAAGALLGDQIKFSMVTGGDLTTQTIASGGAATLATVAFGTGEAGPGGPLNSYRRDNTNLDIQGYGFASTIVDGTVTVIPEPTTIALLGLGLLAARRRKLA